MLHQCFFNASCLMIQHCKYLLFLGIFDLFKTSLRLKHETKVNTKTLWKNLKAWSLSSLVHSSSDKKKSHTHFNFTYNFFMFHILCTSVLIIQFCWGFLSASPSSSQMYLLKFIHLTKIFEIYSDLFLIVLLVDWTKGNIQTTMQSFL